jgi:hypothetical protein
MLNPCIRAFPIMNKFTHKLGTYFTSSSVTVRLSLFSVGSDNSIFLSFLKLSHCRYRLSFLQKLLCYYTIRHDYYNSGITHRFHRSNLMVVAILFRKRENNICQHTRHVIPYSTSVYFSLNLFLLHQFGAVCFNMPRCLIIIANNIIFIILHLS